MKMAELGVEAIKTIAEGGEKPANTPGKEFYDTGVALVTDEKAEGVDSISVAEGESSAGASSHEELTDWLRHLRRSQPVRGSNGLRSNRRNYYDKEVHVTTTVEPPPRQRC